MSLEDKLMKNEDTRKCIARVYTTGLLEIVLTCICFSIGFLAGLLDVNWAIYSMCIWVGGSGILFVVFMTASGKIHDLTGEWIL